ncbi:DUF6638 family protein [Actibacterium lipolyticum]|uniref:Uncharacterized protein n=1 Tax=Actibacterium lipolyticum TaxID=1524263 RepID=A0A238JPT1_9RHOB|nr:DUF6638 family protein [Actibacterium lipolyticum]SMX31872.1 hypothetical protein COL8621_00634 [Actibacterium lipolyticum]
MKRLIQKGLMFGNLIEVSSPALVSRYNRALKHLTGKTTALSDFHIDISGYSPEVGDELGDHLYLNPNGVNRQFILLTTEQKTAPHLNAKFSTSRALLRRFIEVNEPQLFALTAHDAVVGELDNSVFELSTPERLFDIRKITVHADTTREHVASAEKLAGLITRFREEEDAWWDDVLIAQMIGLAKETGDVTRNPIRLNDVSTEQGNFWTDHFGGLYVFRDVEHPAAIAVADKARLGKLPLRYVFDLGDRNQIAHFLELNDLVEPIVKARNVDASAILRQKMDFILVDAAATLGHDLGGANRQDLRKLAQRLGAALPEEFKALGDLARWAEGGGDWPRISSQHPAYFYTLRAAPGPDRDIVNQLLAELSPLDVRQLFICHKQLFYRTYAGWSDAKKGFVADFLEREYQVDKAGARAELFGPEPGMEEPKAPQDDIVARVGPWGAVRRGR